MIILLAGWFIFMAVTIVVAVRRSLLVDADSDSAIEQVTAREYVPEHVSTDDAARAEVAHLEHIWSL